MSANKLNLVILMLISSICAFAYNVSENKAIQVVKEYRALVDDPGKYYVSETDTIVNNWRCPVETLPEEGWANGNYPMWLIFVDEQPNNSIWSHPCKYYYVPKQTDLSLDVPVICLEGVYKAEICSNRRNSINLLESNEIYSISNINFPDIHELTNLYNDKLKVIYIGGECDGSSSPCFYNDAAYFYNVLTRRYNVPDSSIYVLFGSGTDSEREIEFNEQFQRMSLDLNGDGTPDIKESSSLESVINVFESFQYLINPDDHLLVVFDVHGIKDKLLLWDNRFLEATQLKNLLDAVHCASQCIVLSSCYSGTLINDISSSGRIILTSADNTMAYGEPEAYSYFMKKWINALNNTAVNGYIPDTLDNGGISMRHAYEYACLNTYGNYEFFDRLVQNEQTQPQYFSDPRDLGESWAINQLPQLSGDLHIRDTECDWGESGNSNIECAWESPDIWIRNNNDGVTNQFSEPIIVTQNDSTVYVYTRINNNGYNTFEANQRWLHLQWDYPALRHDSIAWASHDIPVALTEPIDTMSSQIITYEWHLPFELRNYAQINNGRLNIDLLARISDTNEFAGQEFDAWYPFEYSSLKNVATNPKMAQKCVYHNEDYNKPLMVKTNISLNTGETTLRISPLQGGFGMHEVYYVINETDTLRPTTDTPDVLLSNLQSHNQITIYCKTNVPRSQTQTTTDIPIALYDNNGTLLGGCTLRMKVAGHGFVGPLNPGIGDSGGIDDGGEIGGPIFGGRTLSMTNVSEPVSCEWTDSHGNVLGNNEYLCIAMNASEEYTLTVTSLVDGEVASVSKAVQPMSYFKNVTSDNGNVLVSLVCPSIPGMSIVVRSAISESICQRYGLPDGNFKVILNTSILDNGVYLISLYYNNQLLETKQIIK